ncbi:hypothetical protein EF847_19985 [Actinobacteria bacterium YIM 96077]|uniref:Uncharacterized protein n=1 Tax=Phytoactinopolyspora halophila TaxID=1981511 RepID=A0A329Q9W8_9ACTN|nr:hypothetical protein [Phytoactinopolyspora halophila]AYY14631.1 hypothetical protein EF847_19985 [Actinobacteria bacterium YIM 96077]RAW09195.1 hypothetical protein DPM12_22345 [Phytoactinopolyspora halophila]
MRLIAIADQKVLVATLAACVLAVACSDGSSRDTAPEEGAPSPESTDEQRIGATEPALIECSDNIGGDRPDPDEYHVVDSGVALPSTNEPALQATQLTETDDLSELDDIDEQWYYAKRGLVLRGGHEVELSIPSDHVDDVRLRWGHTPSRPATSVRAECPPADGWLAFAGGYVVREPGCYSIRVQVDDGQPQEIDVGVGAPCPGQDPPSV